MKDKNEFYIGWQEKMPSGNQRFVKRIVIFLFVALPLLVTLVVGFQRPFNNHQFEFGNLKSITGVYYAQPFPILIADEGILPDSLSRELLLVGYGKFGAKGIMNEIEDQHGLLSGKKITLSGTLIYGDGKSLLELTDETESLIEVKGPAVQPNIPLSASQEVTMKGEILDPKCYFGVMKPGEGKIHKSCAIRCISGGIPPVMRQARASEQDPYRYYLMVDQNGQAINKAILPLVGEAIQLKGLSRKFMNWDMLYLDVDDIELASE